jgi:hypothetical protein
MGDAIYRYQISADLSLSDVSDTFQLALIVTEAIHGEISVLLDGKYSSDFTTRTWTIDSTSPVGRSLSRLFTGLLVREFGGHSFTVERFPPGGLAVDVLSSTY